MTNIIVVFPKIEDAKSIKNVLVRNGFSAMAACTTGAQAIGLAEDYTNGIVICGYKLIDMLYSELLDCLPEGMQMLLMASNAYLGEVNLKGAGRDIVCLSMQTPAAQSQGAETGGDGPDQRGEMPVDGAEPYVGRGSAQIYTEMQYGQQYQHGGDG